MSAWKEPGCWEHTSSPEHHEPTQVIWCKGEPTMIPAIINPPCANRKWMTGAVQFFPAALQTLNTPGSCGSLAQPKPQLSQPQAPGSPNTLRADNHRDGSVWTVDKRHRATALPPDLLPPPQPLLMFAFTAISYNVKFILGLMIWRRCGFSDEQNKDVEFWKMSLLFISDFFQVRNAFSFPFCSAKVDSSPALFTN